MRNGIAGLMAMLCLAAIGTASAADKVVVIVNAANTQSTTLADLRNIYNDIVINWDNGQHIALYDIPAGAAARKVFSESVLGVSPEQAVREWANRIITNTAKNNPPKTVKEELVPRYVASDPYAIGYVSKSVAEGQAGIKIIMTLE